MNKTFKKVLSVALSLAMVLTSITVYNTTTKADGEVEVTASVVNNMINAKWSQPDVEFATLAFFINEADNVQLDSAHWAKAANGHCWTAQNPKATRTDLDTVLSSNDNSIDVSKGGTFVISVQYYDAEGNVVASGTSNAVTTEKLTNTDLNLKVERYETGKAYLGWSIIGGAKKYEVYNADTNELMKTVDNGSDKWTDVTIKQGVTYNLVVKAFDANGEEITITNNTVQAYQANTDMNLTVSYDANTATLTWKKITNVSKYEVYDGNDKIAELNADTEKYVMSNLVEDAEHNITIKAIDANDKEMTISNNTKTVVYTTVSKAPTEHTKADFSNATWAELSTKAGEGDNRYFINADHTLSQAVWYGIYAPHSKAAYHGERTACILSDDAASFTFQQRDVTSVWINGTEYANPSTALNCQGDCTEISTEFLNAGINVVTIVMSDGKTNTFGIKVDAPLGVDATAPAAQDTIDPATVAEWTQMAGTTANGSKVFKDATVTTSTNGGLDGCYAANSSPKWNITDIMNAKAVFGVVHGDAKSVIIDGVEYINAKDARSTKVYIGGADCVYVDAALLDAPEGTTQYHMITVTGGTPLTFIVKVEGPELPTTPTAKVTVDGKEVPVENGKVTLGDAKYGYLCANKMYKAGTEVTVNEDMEFTSVNTLSVAMTDGAGIRYIGESGLRFQSTIASDNMEAVASDAITEGTLITTKVIFDNNNDTLELGYSHAMINVKNSGWFGDKVGTYCGSVCKITDNKREFIARSYVTVNYEDGTSKTVYSGMGPSRSVQFVAQAIIDAKYPGIDEKYHSVIDDYAK